MLALHCGISKPRPPSSQARLRSLSRLVMILGAAQFDVVLTPEECDVYRSRTIKQPRTPLGVQCLRDNFYDVPAT